jgi:hypothetical protein
MLFDSLIESILEEGSLLVMAQGVASKLKHKQTSKAKALEHLKDIIKSAKNQEDKQAIKDIIDSLVNEGLLLEQPHMDFDVEGYNVLFDPELEGKSYQEAVELFRRILSGEEVQGKYNSLVHLPKGLERAFVQALIKDVVTMNFIKLWLSAIGRKTNSSYTVSQFFKDAGMLEHIKEEDTRKVYRVKWYHYPTNRSIDVTTTAASEDQAKTFIYNKNKDGKLRYIKYKDFAKNSKATPTSLQEKKQVNCWKGYKKKGTKKLFGKIVNNCVKK